jgi:hypothetical protein
VIGKLLHTGVVDYAWFRDGYPTREFVQDMTRLLLVGVFVFWGILVWNAWRRKKGAAS